MTKKKMTEKVYSDLKFRWLITGGCGFIGRNLIKNLSDEGGHFIRVIDDLSVGSPEDLSRVCNFNQMSSASFLKQKEPVQKNTTVKNSAAELVVGDILDFKLAQKAVHDVDIIVHLAANTGVGPSVENPFMDCEKNVFGTVSYLEAVRKNGGDRKFIFASSGAPVGEVVPPIHEEIAPHPVSPYGASKLAGEAYCSAYFQSYGVESVALRFGNVYGPFSAKKESVVAKFIKQAIQGEVSEVYGDGKQTRDFIYIDDLIRAIRCSAVKDNVGGEIFQIATAKEHTVLEIVKIIERQLKKKEIEMKYTHASPRAGDVQRNFSDTTKAEKILGWESKIDVEIGIKKTVDWFFCFQKELGE